MSNVLGLPTHDLWTVKIRSDTINVVDTAPVLIASGATALPLRKGFLVSNFNFAPLYIGDSAVTTSTGLIVFPFFTMYIPAGEHCEWYAITENWCSPLSVQVIEGY